MHKSTKFYKWRQRFLRRNPGISGPEVGGNATIDTYWDFYNGKNIWVSLFVDLVWEQVPGKEFRD